MDLERSVVLVVRAWTEDGEVRVRLLADGAVQGVWVAASVPDAVAVVRRVLQELLEHGDAAVTPGETAGETPGRVPPDMPVQTTDRTPG